MDDLWKDLIGNMRRYFQWYFLDDFNVDGMMILDQEELYSDNEEVILDAWILYRWEPEDRMGVDMVFHANIDRANQTFSIQRYDYDHDTRWGIDSQESHAL